MTSDSALFVLALAAGLLTAVASWSLVVVVDHVRRNLLPPWGAFSAGVVVGVPTVAVFLVVGTGVYTRLSPERPWDWRLLVAAALVGGAVVGGASASARVGKGFDPSSPVVRGAAGGAVVGAGLALAGAAILLAGSLLVFNAAVAVGASGPVLARVLGLGVVVVSAVSLVAFVVVVVGGSWRLRRHLLAGPSPIAVRSVLGLPALVILAAAFAPLVRMNTWEAGSAPSIPHYRPASEVDTRCQPARTWMRERDDGFDVLRPPAPPRPQLVAGVGWKANVGDLSAPLLSDGAGVYVTTSEAISRLDGASGREQWRHDLHLSRVGAGPVIFDGALHYLDFAELIRLDPATGAAITVANLTPGNNLALEDDTAYIGGMRVDAIALDTERSRWAGASRWRSRWAPLMADGSLVVVDSMGVQGDRAVVAALDEATGQARWQHVLPKGSGGAPAVADGHVYVVDAGGDVIALDAHTGKERWRFRLRSVPTGVLVVHDSSVFVLDHGGILSALESQTGAERWCRGVDATTAVAARGAVFVPESGGLAGHPRLVVLDAATGASRGDHALPAPPGPAPVPTTPGLVVPLADGVVAFMPWR